MQLFPNIEKTLENFQKIYDDELNKTSCTSNGDVDNEKEPFTEFKFPNIFFVSNNSLILETKEKLYLINYEDFKIKILLNKTENKRIKIIYTYNENVTRIKKDFIRTYIFCIDIQKNLFFFYIEDEFFNQSKQKIILHKMSYAGNEIIDLEIFCLSHKTENLKYFLFVFLNKNSVLFLITEFCENDLGTILNSFNYDSEYQSDNNDMINNSTKMNLSYKNNLKIINLLEPTTNNLTKIGINGNLIKFQRKEFKLNSDFPINRIKLNETNDLIYLSFFDESYMYNIIFNNNITPKKLRDLFDFDSTNRLKFLNRISNFLGLVKALNLNKSEDTENISNDITNLDNPKNHQGIINS